MKTVVTISCVLVAGFATLGRAASIQFYYTTLGSPDVFSDTYNTTANSTGSALPIGTSQQGADGIITGPAVGGKQTLFFTGETDQTIFQINTTGGAAVSSGNAGTTAFLLSENPQGTTLFTENNVGTISTVPLSAGGTISGAGTLHSVTGADTNVSQLAWGMNPIGPVFYVTGGPGTNGNLGTLNATTFATTRLDANITTAQDEVFDPYTGLIVLFGQGQINTLNPVTDALGTPINIPGGTCAADTFTTGAVDGAGHALILDCGQLDYIDYSSTHNILAGSIQSTTSPTGAKDLAIFQAPSTTIPEPSTIVFMMTGLALVTVGYVRFRSKLVTRKS